MTEFRYKAFISYSHKNSRQAAWLMKKLEAFRIPRHLSARTGDVAKHKKLGKMFRDREELPASTNMDGNIHAALKSSEYLIVVCSDDAAKSSRVNNEIRQFIRHRDSRKILCLIVDGEPNFEVTGLKDYEGCIPPELRKLHLVTGQTPLAADARAVGDGHMRAFHKIIAGLLGVDLDDLLRRDTRRKHHRLIAITLASIAATLATTILMLRANNAEIVAKEALSRAEMQTSRAEDLVSFMLDDLVIVRLRELGRIEVIDAVVEKVVDHYASQTDDTLSPEALARKARSFSQLGRLYLERDQPGPAAALFENARKATQSLLERNPNSRDAQYAHLVSLLWTGANHLYNGRYSEAERAWRERAKLGQSFRKHKNLTKEMREHVGDIHVHLGWALMELGRPGDALDEFNVGLTMRQENVDREPDNTWWLNLLAGGLYHLQWAQQYLGQLDDALDNMRLSSQMYQQLAEEDPSDQRAMGNYARSLRQLAQTEVLLGRDDSAKRNIELSIKMHEQLLSFEPNNLGFEYQACVSAVVMAEIFWRQGDDSSALRQVADTCPRSDAILSLDHFKAHQRFYGYRLELMRLDIYLNSQKREQALDQYRKLDSHWKHETAEVRNSIQGRHVALILAMQSVALNKHDDLMPDANSHLAAVVADVGGSFFNGYPPGAKLLQQARQLVSQHTIKNEVAR